MTDFSIYLSEAKETTFQDWLNRQSKGFMYRFWETGGEGWEDCEIYLHEFKILKETRCGCWIELGHKSKRFVLNDARKKYAHRAINDAAESFLARKRRQHRIYQYRTDLTAKAISKMENLMKDCK